MERDIHRLVDYSSEGNELNRDQLNYSSKLYLYNQTKGEHQN